jgi:hypothetical protein
MDIENLKMIINSIISLDLDKIINNPVNIVLAVIIVDIIALISARNNLVGKVINEWYDKFTIGAFTADVCSMIFLIYIALMLFKYVLVPKFNIPFNLFTFLLSIVVIQMIHDFIFALIIMKYPETQNDMVNVFKKYIDEGSFIILGVDALMMITSVLLISLFYYFDSSLIIYLLLSLSLYFAMFLIY